MALGCLIFFARSVRITFIGAMGNDDRRIECQVQVPAGLEEVWTAWTTARGAQTFFAPQAQIDSRVGGRYELLFDLSAPEGFRGSEGMTILAIQPMSMLSFTWNAPPSLSTVRGQLTHVQVRLQPVGPALTIVRLAHDGWGCGGEWDKAFAYFQRAWDKVVLQRLVYRFAHGPVDWTRPPDL